MDNPRYKVKDEVLPIHEFTADEIRRIRKDTGTTQGFFANWLGVSKKTVQAWESGRNIPSGASARLLSLLEDKTIGIGVFLKNKGVKMDILDVNSYINAASEALQDDPEYNRWFKALANERSKIMSGEIAHTGTIEGILYELWALKLAYILDHKEELDNRFHYDFEKTTENK